MVTGQASGFVRQIKKRWYVVVKVDDQKKQLPGGSATKREAEGRLRAALSEIDQGQFVTPSVLRLGECLDKWLAESVKPIRSPRTYARYEEIVRVHIKPRLGDIPLSKLRPLDIQSLYNEKRKVVSEMTVLHIHRVLHTALQRLTRWEMLRYNPIHAVDAPRPRKKEIQAVDEASLWGIIEAARGSTIYIGIVLAAATGMRLGEVCALAWGDVDLENRTVYVHRSLEQIGTNVRVKGTKTDRGRWVVLPEWAVVELARHKEEQEQRKSAGRYRDHGLVFANKNGTPRKIQSVSRQFKRCNFGVTFHGLRHSHASILGRKGIPLATISKRLGHSNVTTTANTYTHVFEGMDEEAAQSLERKAV